MYGVNVKTRGAGSFWSRGVYTVAFNFTPSRSGIFTPHWNLTCAGSGGGGGASAKASHAMRVHSRAATIGFMLLTFDQRDSVTGILQWRAAADSHHRRK